MILSRSFYTRGTVEVARDLLGKVVRRSATSGIIVETEAYLGGDDLAAHSARGLTERTRVIFGPPGHAYVYLIYGVYDCLNLVAEPDGQAGCVLIRALEPLDGLEVMRERRPRARKVEDLTSGPGRLTMALGITRAECYGADVCAADSGLTVEEGPDRGAFEIVAGPRVGITQCVDWPLRFWVGGNRFVSRG